MRTRYLAAGAAWGMLALMAGGCATPWIRVEEGKRWHFGPGQRSVLPPTGVRWPQTSLTLSWNGERYEAPRPVEVPGELLLPGLKRWHVNNSALWRVPLGEREGGRVAVVMATPGVEGDPVIDMMRVWIYRADGTLEQEQHNVDEEPNAPIYWIVYEADGKTKRTEVQCGRTSDPRVWHIAYVKQYAGGKPAWSYEVSEAGIVQVEDRYNADGTRTLVNARFGIRASDFN